MGETLVWVFSWCLIKGIDGLSGAKDLSSLSNFDVRWNGGAASDSLGANYGSGLGVQLVNLDNGAYANDLLLTAFIADVNGKADSGAVYLIKGVDGLSGAKDLVNLNNFDVRWNGATSYDDLGGTTQSGLASLGVQLVNMDGGRYANDLLLTAAFADVGGYSNNGAVYLIRNINGLSGIKDLNSSGSYDALFRGGFDSEQLGNTGNSGAGVQVVNIDQGTYTNDLLLSSYTASIGSKLYAGVVYLIRDPVIKTADLNFVSFDWNSGSFGMPSFSFVRDGNVTIDFNVFDSDNYRLKVDINYSTTNTAGTGTSIVRDLNLTLTNCTSQDWNVSPVDCNYDWNISSLLVADGNYYILIKIDDNLTPLSKDLGLLQVDNTPPSTLGDGSNNIWQLLDGNIHLTCNDGAGSGCYLTQYRLDTDPTNGVYWGNWQNYSGSILIFGDGNFAIDFNSRDNAGNVGDVNEFFIIIGPHGRLTTYNANVLPRSFFVSSNTVDLRFDANLVLIPPIEIFDSAGTLRDSNYFSLTVSASDINSFDYNFVVSGASGWYDVRIGSQYFPKAFYKGTVWQSRFMDDSNNVFPFSYDLNVTEPNIINRWLSSFDTNVNFTYGANPSSIRVLDCNETGACIEIPSQIYDSVTNSGLVTSARLVFPASIGKNETRHFIVSYSSQSLPKSYFVDFNTLQNGYIFDFNNSIFKMTVDMNKGGNITRIVSNRASISDLNGSTLMFYSPSTFSGGITNNPASLVNPSFSIDANGPLVSIISVSGTVGGMSYTEKYKVYANTSFFLYDQNISSNQSGVLWVLSDSYSFFSARKFNKYANFTNNTLSVNDVNTLNNTLSGGDANFVGVYDKSTLDGVGEIFLSRQSSISHVPPTISFYDQAAYSYWQRQVYSGQVNNGDYFSSSSAVAVFNPWN
ncbi:MAG: hypothetical protein NTY48_03090, partial [Candidatus Diapherotrites archaeon]|nr:hypothetical protein [Candidatus Diapherotrites archaeon]